MNTQYRFRQFGFTLLEMVLVLFLIAMLASATLFLTENIDEQAKYDETKRRMSLIRQAIVGDTSRTINNEPELAGFVTDMGRLPLCIAELLELGPEFTPATTPVSYESPCDSSVAISPWTLDEDSQVGIGWRGPYLQVLPESDGELRFRDGYGNSDANDATNSGWKTFNVNFDGSIDIISERLNDSDNDISVENLVVENDYLMTKGSSWEELTVQLTPQAENSFTLNQDTLRVRLNYPVNGEIIDWSDSSIDSSAKRDVSPYLTATFPNLDLSYNHALTVPTYSFSVAVSETLEIPTTATTASTTTINDLQAGDEITYTSTDGRQARFYLNNSCSSCSITVPTGNLVGNIYTFNASNDVVITASEVDVFEFTVNRLAKSFIAVPAGSSISSNTLTLADSGTIALPADSSDTVINNIVVLGDSDITTSDTFVMVGNVVSLDSSDDQFWVPNGTQVISSTQLAIPARLTLPVGERTLSIICESTGELFSSINSTTNACENGADTRPQPYSLKFVPRTATPSKPEPLIWRFE